MKPPLNEFIHSDLHPHLKLLESLNFTTIEMDTLVYLTSRDVTAKEIAQKLGHKSSTHTTHIYRLRKRLKKAYNAPETLEKRHLIAEILQLTFRKPSYWKRFKKEL